MRALRGPSLRCVGRQKRGRGSVGGMCFCGVLFAFELWSAERYFVENER